MPVTRNRNNLIRIARRDVARDFRALFKVAADRVVSRGRAGAVGLLEAAVAAIEARNQPLAPFPARCLGVDQRLHLVAPDLPFARAANVTQIMQRAEDFRQPLQIALVGCPPSLCRLAMGGGYGKNQQEDRKKSPHGTDMPAGCGKGKARRAAWLSRLSFAGTPPPRCRQGLRWSLARSAPPAAASAAPTALRPAAFLRRRASAPQSTGSRNAAIPFRPHRA